MQYALSPDDIFMKFGHHSTFHTMAMALALMTIALTLDAAEVTYHFDIKPQPLAEALMAFGAQASTSVVAPTELTRGKISTPVYGDLTIKYALAQMLQGTGLGFDVTATGTIVIVRASVQGISAS
jgi:hypothetical protein